MRNIDNWYKVWREREMALLPPRIQKDINRFNMMEDSGVVESEFIYGDSGTGKTLRAAMLFLQESRMLYLSPEISKFYLLHSVQFISVADLFDELKKEFGKPNEQWVIDKYKHSHLLVLDDIGIIPPSDWALNVLYLIINHRYEFLKKTIFTSNKSIDELEFVLGDERIPARIYRMCKRVKKERNW